MSKSVLDLQNDCLNHSIPCSLLLLKAFAIARKLNIAEMVDFCKNELDGYQENSENIPIYRNIHIHLELCDGYRWRSVSLPNNSYLAEHTVLQPIKELEVVCSGKEKWFHVKLTTEQIKIMQKIFSQNRISDGRKLVSAYQLEGIVFRVKKILLEWALKLGEDGIWGENLEFTNSELNKAQNISITNIFNAPSNGNNFIGSMANSSATINNGFDFAKVTDLINQISQNIKVLHLPENQEIGLSSDISEIKDMIAQKDESGIRKVLHKIDCICQNITGNVVAAGIIAQIASILG